MVKLPPVDISQTPQQLALALNISLFAGQVISSAIFICLFFFPALFLAKKFRLGDSTSIIVGVLSAGVCIAIGWLPVWVFAVICLLLALGYAKMFSGMFR